MKKILIVDDQAFIRHMLGMELSRSGYKVHYADNGKTGFEEAVIIRHDLILLDIMMPVMDGLTAARTIRALERSDAQTVPIVALSANAFAEDEAESQQAGINDYLSKPLNAQQLIKTLKKYLH